MSVEAARSASPLTLANATLVSIKQTFPIPTYLVRPQRLHAHQNELFPIYFWKCFPNWQRLISRAVRLQKHVCWCRTRCWSFAGARVVLPPSCVGVVAEKTVSGSDAHDERSEDNFSCFLGISSFGNRQRTPHMELPGQH